MASKKGKDEAAAAANPGGDIDGLSREDLVKEVQRLQEELKKEREERNFFQLERDKVNEFWQISKSELEEAKSELLNKDRELEELEEKHQVEIKVYKQKVKHLLYEYQNNVTALQTDSEKHLGLAQDEHAKSAEVLKKQCRSLKLELKELELSHQEVIKNLKLRHDQETTELRADFDRRCKELYNKFTARTKTLREDLELRRKNEIHEVEERKNGQINALMKNHEKAFAEIKNYYNDITLNNLALINSLKEQVEEMKKKDERNEKLMADITAENKRLKEPLDAALAEGERLKRQLKSYEKDKMALTNSKARLKVLEEAHKQLSWEKEVLDQRFEQVKKERDQLYSEFLAKCRELEQRVGFKNIVLEKKLASARENLEKKDLQLHEMLATLASAQQGGSEGSSAQPTIDAAQLQVLSSRIASLLDAKQTLIKDLHYELARVVKAHNEVLRVFEAKMGEWGVPVEELGFRPLVVKVKGVPTVGAEDAQVSLNNALNVTGKVYAPSSAGGVPASSKKSETPRPVETNT